MRAGRKVNLRELLEGRDGSDVARRRAELLMKNLKGELTMGDVARELGVNEAMAYRYRDQFLQGAIDGLEPRHRGRPASERSEEAVRIADLQEKVKDLQRELLRSRLKEELHEAIPELGRRKKNDGVGEDRRE